MDAKRIDQVFTNLLSNAVKYAPNAPRVEVTAAAVGSDIVVSVRDFGLGIPNSELPKIFEKFFRASTSTGISGSEEHTSELQSLMRISYAVFCLKKKN